MKSNQHRHFACVGSRLFRTAAALLLILAIAVILPACGKGGADPSENDANEPNNSVSDIDGPATEAASAETKDASNNAAADVNIVRTAASSLKLVDQDTEAFTMQIPDGWEMRYGWDGEKLLMIRVYDPEQPVNQIFFATDMVPFMKSEAAAREYARTGMTMFSEAVVLDPPTNANLFSQIPKLRTYYREAVKMETAAEIMPEIFNFELLESADANSAFRGDNLDDSVLYGTFRNADGSALGEGMFFSSIEDNYSGMHLDLSYYNVYNCTMITSVKDEFVNYKEILLKSSASLNLKQEFIDLSLQNSQTSFSSLQQINAAISASYYSYNSAWMARSQSQDIARQKQSDATLGYERVYDTETGDIYKAYNGFTDDYTGSRYQPVSDDMYTQGWSGYIEK